MHVVHVAHLHGHAVEVGRVLDVGRGCVPLVQRAIGRGDGVPARVALEHVGVVLLEHLRADGGGDGVADFLVARPDVAQIHRLPIAAGAQRLGGEVDIGGAGDGVGHHQRRRGQIIHLDLGVHAAFEVAVARQHRSHHQIVLGNGCRHVFRQRAGVADAGGAAVADHVETKLFQVGEHAGLFKIVGDHARTRSERGLDPRLRRQSLGCGIAREQPCAQHHRRVGGVGAGGDRGDDHRAIAQLPTGTAGAGAFCLRRLRTDGGAAATFVLEAVFLLEIGQLLAARVGERLEAFAVVGLHVFQQHAVLRALGAGQRWLDLAHVQFQRGAVPGGWGGGVVPQALRLGIGLDQRNLLLAAAGQAQIGQRLLVDREDAAGGAVFGRHVADGGAVGQRQVLQAVAIELDELAHHAELAQHLGDRQHQVGGSGALGQLASELEAHDLRNQH